MTPGSIESHVKLNKLLRSKHNKKLASGVAAIALLETQTFVESEDGCVKWAEAGLYKV